MRDCFKQNKGLNIANHQAWKVQRSLVGNAQSEQATKFFQLPDYAEKILDSDPGAFVKVHLSFCLFCFCANVLLNCTVTDRMRSSSRNFHSLFVCPTPAQTVRQKSQRFIALDGVFTKTAFDYVLMLAGCYNSPDSLVVYAWATAPSETYATWAWF